MDEGEGYVGRWCGRVGSKVVIRVGAVAVYGSICSNDVVLENVVSVRHNATIAAELVRLTRMHPPA